jgi:hypothetical protein
MDLTKIYLNKMDEVMRRLQACSNYFNHFKSDESVISLESAITQLRKTMECIALASIAPNHQAYSEYRSNANKNSDYRKDYNGTKILKILRAINEDFYPIALVAPTKTDGKWHFERKRSCVLSSRKFESFYDRLGKFLHADNPWGQNKGLKNLVNDIPTKISEIEELLKIHFTTIRSGSFAGVWVIEVPFYSNKSRVLVGKADDDFIVTV